MSSAIEEEVDDDNNGMGWYGLFVFDQGKTIHMCL